MKHTTLCFAIFLMPLGALFADDLVPDAAPVPGYVYRAKVERVKDGDTVVLQLDLGFSTWRHDSFRMLRLYVPETFRPKDEAERIAGEKVKAFLVKRLPAGKAVVVRTERDKKDKYGRYLVEVWDATGNVNSAVIKFMEQNGIKSNRTP